MGADDSFFFSFREHIHHAFVALGPVPFHETVHEADVDGVSA